MRPGDPAADEAVARDSCAVFALPGWTVVEIQGADRTRFLHNFSTNDIQTLSTGTGCEAFLTNVQGRVVAHVYVLATEGSLLLIGTPDQGPRIAAHLSRYQINEQVSICDRSRDFCLLLASGPQARSVAAEKNLPLPEPAAGHNCNAQLGDAPVRLISVDVTGRGGLAFLSDTLDGPQVQRELTGVWPLSPAGRDIFNVLRIEAAFPIYGVDFTDQNLAQEVSRTPLAISFRKGCYLGQEPIARIDALGHVNQHMRIIRLSEGPFPQPGDELVEDAHSARALGRVTSAAWSQRARAPVAMAIVRRGYDAPGQIVCVRASGQLIQGTIDWPRELLD
jgi:hypothetical protein